MPKMHRGGPQQGPYRRLCFQFDFLHGMDSSKRYRGHPPKSSLSQVFQVFRIAHGMTRAVFSAFPLRDRGPSSQPWPCLVGSLLAAACGALTAEAWRLAGLPASRRVRGTWRDWFQARKMVGEMVGKPGEATKMMHVFGMTGW